VIVAVPDATALIKPLDTLTVAMLSSLLVHAPPALPLELNVVVPLTQIESAPLTVPAFGAAVTVTVLVAVSFAHPPVPVITYLIVVVPAATGVITPVLASTLATPVFTELNVPPVSPSVANVVVPSEQIDWVPLSEPAFAAVVTVTVLVADESLQPPVPVTVYVIVAVPAATAVTTPEEAFTVATSSSLLVQAPPASPFELNVVVPLEQIACVPLIVPALGAVVTVTALVAVSFAQPPVPVITYLIVVVPAATGVITPVLASTVATPVFTELNVPPASPSDAKVVVPSEHTA
jgi:PPE-repeat protein